MLKTIKRTIMIFASASMLFYLFVPYAESAVDKVSGFGEYRGYSRQIYDGYIRSSDYLTLSDGTQLAYDLLLPTNRGAVAKSSLPVLFCFTTYLRAYDMVKDGKVIDNDVIPINPFKKAFIWARAKLVEKGDIFDMAFLNKWVEEMLMHGYAVAVVEQRGTGASEGIMNPSYRMVAEDADEILNWIGSQSWSNGKIGMFGKSSLAMAQYAAASTGNPHLKAIFPVSSSFDMYNAVIYPGGIFNKAFAEMFSSSTSILENMAVPVDSDIDGKRLNRILEYRRKTFSIDRSREEGFEKSPFRDSRSSHPKGYKLWEDLGIYTLLDRVNKSDIPIYNASGWFDIFLRDTFLLHNNLTGKRKLYVGPLSHYALGKDRIDQCYEAEAHRWFDYWLKGIDNGIMSEPFIHYFLMEKPGKGSWKTASEWPLRIEKRTRFFLSEGSHEGGDKEERGLLTTSKPEDLDAADSYTINYSTTSGVRSRWNSIIQHIDYPDMRPNDEKGLIYTTRPLKKDMEVTGHPVIHLVFSTGVDDIDFFAYLEEVDSEGRSAYISEGCLRASHRELGKAPFNNMCLPFHRGGRNDVRALSAGEPAEITFDLLPVSKLFRKGCRIRVSITCADSDNFRSRVLHPAPEIYLFKNSVHSSFIELPLIEENSGS